jgi:hypothetical protein
MRRFLHSYRKMIVIRDESQIQVNIPIVIDPKDFPKMYNDDDRFLLSTRQITK